MVAKSPPPLSAKAPAGQLAASASEVQESKKQQLGSGTGQSQKNLRTGLAQFAYW